MADRITYAGLDVHKESIVVAVASGGLRGEVREYGRIANTPTALLIWNTDTAQYGASMDRPGLQCNRPVRLSITHI
jgi:transposase